MLAGLSRAAATAGLTGFFGGCYKHHRLEGAVPIDPKLLEILACPACRTAVAPTPDGAALLCAACGRRYPIVDDIPVMLVEEATIEPEGRRGA
jgi:uncharacterized protein YbaR (Trm112 family)